MNARIGLYLSVGLVSAAALAYQLLLLRLLAIVQWSILAGTVVSLALLGHGASGTALALLRERATRHATLLYGLAAGLFAASAPLCFALAQRVPFNALELAWDPRQWLQLAAVYGVLALPFFFAAACFGLAFMRHGRDTARIYAADLVGAAAGAGALTLLLWRFPPEALLRLIAVVAALGGLLAVGPGSPPNKAAGWAEHREAHRAAMPGSMGFAVAQPILRFARRLRRVAEHGWLPCVAVALAVWLPASWIAPQPSEYKGEQRLLAVMGAQRLERRSSPYGVLSVVASPRVPLRHAPGLSLQARGEPPPQLAVFTDGDAMTTITQADHGPGDRGDRGDLGDLGDLDYLDYLGQMTSALPYALLQKPRVLVLNSGGGDALLQALALGAAAVTAVEPNPQLLDLVRSPHAGSAAAVYADPRVRALARDPRTFLRDDTLRYDLIQVPPAESYAGSGSGVLAAAEAYLYTVDAIGDALDRLTDGGLLAFTRWERLPPRDSVKLLATVVAALEARGIRDPGERLALIRSWQTSTLLVKNGGFDETQRLTLRAFCARLGFDPVHDPGAAAAPPALHHRSARPYLYEAAQALLSPRAPAFIEAYKFDVAPTSDDRPFFFQFLKWSAVPELLRLREQGGVALLDVGYLLVVATALQALLYSLLLIGLPLRWLQPSAPRAFGRTALYFAALGLAFLFIEIVWLHRLVLLLGHPLLAASAGLSAFLLFAGLGSAAADRWRGRWRHAAVPAAVAALLGWLLPLELLWQPLLDLTLRWPLELRALAAVLSLAPLAFCMGLPFPLGLRHLSAGNPQLVPWAWGINGCLSVCAAALASLLAMHFGFRAVVLAAAALYAVAATTLRSTDG